MARTSKLKVYRTAAGFHDAYVAAPSQKAALAAWGSEHDLFARGIAELVTDADLAAEPLASPGVVIKRSRGTTAEQIAALPARAAPTGAAAKPVPEDAADDAAEETPRHRRTSRADTAKPARKPVATPRPAAPPKPPPVPKPSRAALEAAETALETSEADHRRALRALADREAALARERARLERARDADLRQARKMVDAETRRYDDAVKAWKR